MMNMLKTMKTTIMMPYANKMMTNIMMMMTMIAMMVTTTTHNHEGDDEDGSDDQGHWPALQRHFFISLTSSTVP